MGDCTYRVDDLPERIAVKIAPKSPKGCWEWTGSRNPGGYGKVRWEGRSVYAHRLTFHLLADSTCPIQPGRHNGASVLDHVRCDNPGCVNPAHLQLTSHRSNLSRHPGSSSEFIGVCWESDRARWKAAIRNGGSRNLGRYHSELEAATAYDDACEIIDGTRPNGTVG